VFLRRPGLSRSLLHAFQSSCSFGPMRHAGPAPCRALSLEGAYAAGGDRLEPESKQAGSADHHFLCRSELAHCRRQTARPRRQRR
jgi:hypothetical protein